MQRLVHSVKYCVVPIHILLQTCMQVYNYNIVNLLFTDSNDNWNLQ